MTFIPTAGATEKGWHAIETYLRCPKAYQYKQLRKVRRSQGTIAPALALGIMVHAGRAAWFLAKQGTDARTIESVKESMRLAAEAEKTPMGPDVKRQAERYVMEYIDHWSKRVAPQVVVVEHSLSGTALLKGDPDFWQRTARLDDVSCYPEAAGQLCIGELKTTSHSINDCVQEYTLHGQPMLQMLLWEASKDGAAKHGPVVGVMLDVIKKGYGNERCQFGRQLLMFSDSTLAAFRKSFRAFLRGAEKMTADGPALRNYKGCTFCIAGRRVVCEYRDLCLNGKGAAGLYSVDGKPMALDKTGAWR